MRRTVRLVLLAGSAAVVGVGPGTQLGCSVPPLPASVTGARPLESIPAGCTVSSTLSCSYGTGIDCAIGSSPQPQGGICSFPGLDDGAAGFCCFALEIPGCRSDYATTLNCTWPRYGFTCAHGSPTPEADDPEFACSNLIADDDGNDDYCCDYTPGGGGPVVVTPPAGCVVDTSVDCSASGAVGYACDAGDDPGVEDPTLSCSAPTPDGSQDDYCCTD